MRKRPNWEGRAARKQDRRDPIVSIAPRPPALDTQSRDLRPPGPVGRWSS